MRNMGTYLNPTVTARQFKSSVRDGAIQNSMASLVSELEKRSPVLREPLTSLTYARDVPIKVGGGWVESLSSMSVEYGVTGGSGAGPVSASGANGIPMAQINYDKDIWKTHVVQMGMRIMHIDLERSKITGRGLEGAMRESIRKTYDKHMEENAYTGIQRYGSFGLLNHPDVPAANVAPNTASSTLWKNKTPEEIRDDINEAIDAAWESAFYDRDALPNHILLPYAQFNLLVQRTNSDLANISILEYLLKNNITTANGGDLQIYATAWNKGAGAGGSDRMVVYCHNDRFLSLEELVPLNRTMTTPSAADGGCYDSIYSANISELELFYPETLVYRDGI